MLKKLVLKLNSVTEPANRPDEDFFHRLLKKVVFAYKVLGVAFMISAFTILSVNLAPGLFYRVNPGSINSDAETIVSTISAEELTELNTASVLRETTANGNYLAGKALPKKNPNLPLGNHLIINKIGVRGQTHEGEDGIATMDNGIWQQSYNDNPANGTILLASHRYGLLSWSKEYRDQNSFYKLPELVPGDEIIYFHDQREFKYTISKVYTDTKIEAVDTDLILYTCKFFGAKERIIVLADASW